MGCFTPPPYNPDLARFDYYVLIKLKEELAGSRISSDEEVKKAVNNWTEEAVERFYEEEISQLVSRYTKSIEVFEVA